MKQVMTPHDKLGTVVGVRKSQSKIKVQYKTDTGVAETWFNEADCKPVKIVAVEEKPKKQELIKEGEEPWKYRVPAGESTVPVDKSTKEIKVSDKPKINKGLAGGVDQYQG
jgi:hypothetical protein